MSHNKNVVSSAAEAETNAVFTNAKLVVSIKNLLQGLGHPQPITTINTDNSTAAGFVNRNMQLKKSKSWDMHLHWLRDRENRQNFKVKWTQGKSNTADYFTKHHSVPHHRTVRNRYVTDLLNHLRQDITNIHITTLTPGTARVC